MEMAFTDLVTGPHADQALENARHQAMGSCSDRGGEVAGCRALADATTEPSSLSTMTTFVLLVDESTPATNVTITSGYRTPSSNSVTS
jgi:hypothetical protein